MRRCIDKMVERVRVDALGAQFGCAFLDDASKHTTGLRELPNVHRNNSVVHPHPQTLVVKLESLLESTESEHLVLERDRSPISLQERLLLVIVLVRGLLSDSETGLDSLDVPRSVTPPRASSHKTISRSISTEFSYWCVMSWVCEKSCPYIIHHVPF
jgi:hypothetical protein